MKLKRLMSAVCCMSAVALMAVACGGNNESECEEGQTFASVNAGPEQCYDTCTDGTCAAGFSCRSGLCVSASANNTSNSTNNANNTSNNTSNSTNNANNSNNSMSNNTMSNNSMSNNNMMCTAAIEIGECEPLCDPTGCDPGFACGIGRTAANAPLTASCVPEGDVAPGGACGGMNGCQAGSVCIVEEAGATMGTCLEICQPGGTCSVAGATCAPQNQEMTVGFCIVPEDACDPLNDMCPAGEACALTNLGLQCFPSAGGMQGSDCSGASTSTTPCDQGLACAQLDTDGDGTPDQTTCEVLCDPNDGSRCTGDTTCMAGTDPAVGICI